MNQYARDLPEPILPEHALIREAGNLPTLSAGLKSRIMADCSVQIASARRAMRLKVGVTVVAVCCLLLVMVPLIRNGHSSSPPQPTADSDPAGTSGSYSHSAIDKDEAEHAAAPQHGPQPPPPGPRLDQILRQFREQQDQLGNMSKGL
ncbi:MAG: hypothetical protein KDA85_07805 [Planctomycetaceae bacterium]|nr:hypothetical protein [Planctomycetaceae bacterium]